MYLKGIGFMSLDLVDNFKICSKCNETKVLSEFVARKSSKDGKTGQCKICIKVKCDMWISNNKEKNSQHKCKYKAKPENKQKNRVYENNRRRSMYKNNTTYKLQVSVRNRIKDCVKTGYSSSFLKYLGCSVSDYRAYLESLFVQGMGWDNWSLKGWHIDHIVPICNFDLAKEEELYKAFHYTNTQPLWALDNLRKPKFIRKDK
jgi:hypothetical protein